MMGMDFQNFQPCFLIALPQLDDPHFEKTVVLLTDYNPEGAGGFIINRKSDLILGDSVIISDGTINPAYNNMILHFGGPVDQEKIWILYDSDVFNEPHSVELAPGINLARDIEILLNKEKSLETNQIRVVNGYSGWSPNQIEAEIAASFWITAPLMKDLIFNTSPEEIWEKAIQRLGIDPDRLMTNTSHFLN